MPLFLPISFISQTFTATVRLIKKHFEKVCTIILKGPYVECWILVSKGSHRKLHIKGLNCSICFITCKVGISSFHYDKYSKSSCLSKQEPANCTIAVLSRNLRAFIKCHQNLSDWSLITAHEISILHVLPAASQTTEGTCANWKHKSYASALYP